MWLLFITGVQFRGGGENKTPLKKKKFILNRGGKKKLPPKLFYWDPIRTPKGRNLKIFGPENTGP